MTNIISFPDIKDKIYNKCTFVIINIHIEQVQLGSKVGQQE